MLLINYISSIERVAACWQLRLQNKDIWLALTCTCSHWADTVTAWSAPTDENHLLALPSWLTDWFLSLRMPQVPASIHNEAPSSKRLFYASVRVVCCREYMQMYHILIFCFRVYYLQYTSRWRKTWAICSYGLLGCNVPGFICWFRHYINCLFAYLSPYFLT